MLNAGTLSERGLEEDTPMSQARYFERRANDPTPEQIRIMCELIRSRWVATGDKRLVPDLKPAKRRPPDSARTGKWLV